MYPTLLLLAAIISCRALQFDPQYTGVMFNPYVKMTNDRASNSINYTLEELGLMLELVSERFSNILTKQSGAKRGPYTKNVIYYNNSNIEVNIAVAAAKMNLDRGKKSLTMLQGLYQFDGEEQTGTEVRMGIECAEKANEIYPGTVEGLAFFRTVYSGEYTNANRTLEYLSFIRNSSVGHLKLGTRLFCHDIYKDTKEDKGAEAYSKTVQKILRISDFVVCDIRAFDETNKKGPVAAFEYFSSKLLEYRRKILEINGGLEIMASMEWSSSGYTWHSLEYFVTFWEYGNQWASNHNFRVWFFEAFDVPWLGNKTHRAHRGWWRLTGNSKANIREGYIEKISEYRSITTTIGPSNVNISSSIIDEQAMSTAVIISITLGCVLAVVFVAFIASLSFRCRPQHPQLRDEDIRQFMEGMGSDFAAQQDDHSVDTLAQQFPYDKSFEILKEHILIQQDKLLGKGQFGCVFKAVISSKPEDSKHVAIKVAKDGCTKSGLRGLLSEIKIMTYIGRHPNIVQMIGAYTKEIEKSIVYIATEYCSLGSLQSHLRKRPETLTECDLAYVNTSEPITFQQMLQWSQEIAAGMEYLGTKNVVHADLATRNVLLTVEGTAKVSDFGLSRRMYDYTNYIKTEQEPLPWRWMAIESLKRCEFSVRSDVWSYGVTLWEIFSLGDTPYSGLGWTTGFVNSLVEGLRLESPVHATPQVYAIMVDCWNMDPGRRPSFSEMREIFKTIAECNGTRRSPSPTYVDL